MGGAKRIGEVAEVLVPFASIVYLLLAVTVLILCRDAIPGAFRAIFEGAFQPKAAFFAVLRIGISRGVFTNEAGMGTASIAHAAAKVDHPAQQGLLGVMEVFLDTIVICTMTALVILCAGQESVSKAFTAVCGPWSSVLLPVCPFSLRQSRRTIFCPVSGRCRSLRRGAGYRRHLVPGGSRQWPDGHPKSDHTGCPEPGAPAAYHRL